jgi:hypothetical protein
VPYINQAGGGGTGAISGVIVSGAAVAGDAIIASSAAAGSWVFPPAHEFGYDQITANANVTGTTEAGANTIITCAAHVFDGAAVICEFCCSQIQFDTNAGTDVLGISLWEGASELGILGFYRPNTAATQEYQACTLQVRFTPTAASHTYLLKAWATSVTGTPAITAGAGGVGQNFPAFIRFTKA